MTSEPQYAPPPVTLMLDLASGQNPRQGYEGVDIWPGAQHVVDLQKYPWPFADESVLEINCSHYIEHIPMAYLPEIHAEWRRCMACVTGYVLGAAGTLDSVACTHCEGTGGHMIKAKPAKDALFAFFDECYRILVPDGWLHIVVPAHRNDRAFQDPTHRRFIPAQTFAYMNEEWRRINKLDHYNVNCHFIGEALPIVSEELNQRVPEVATRMIQRDWNTVIDWKAEMQKKPRLP